MKGLLLIVVMAITMPTLHAYALEGAWALSPPTNSTLAQKPSNIIFQFDQSVEQNEVVGYATVIACKLLVYNYRAEEDEIYFQILQVGRTLR